MHLDSETDGGRLDPEILAVTPFAIELDDEVAPDAIDDNVDSESEPVAEVEVDPDVDVAELAEVEVEVAAAQAALDAEFLDQGTLELLGIYLHEVRRFPLLSAEEEISLSRAYDQGRAATARLTAGVEDRDERVHLDHVARTGERARRKLVESNLRLVISVARKHLNRGMPLGDLIQEGNIGLSRAVDKFDWRRGFRFSTYAYWWIRQAITRSISDQSRVVRIPVHMTGQISRYARASGRMAQELGREPTVEEVAEWMDISIARAEEIRQAAQVPLSLDAPIGDESDSQIGDLVEDDGQPNLVETVSKSLLRDSVGEILAGLNPRERRVVEMRFGISDGKARTLAEVGDELQISRERVRQIETDALRKLRRPTIRRRLAEYLG
ncbi:MAG: sigma-70 family RNA polymerase sigma factor [Chloroflexota bacterium]|nr:MAG: sigma-70 family RNA polymerase sigma factor [Chloroflexota bacterium]